MSTTPQALAHEQELVRAFGVVTLTAAVINIIVGGGIFRLPASMAAEVGGFAPAVFVVGALVMLPIALCFAAAGSRATTTGGAYTYASVAFGPLVGFLTGAASPRRSRTRRRGSCSRSRTARRAGRSSSSCSARSRRSTCSASRSARARSRCSRR
jgi:hypothetical protein